jgi:hypothetical protein
MSPLACGLSCRVKPHFPACAAWAKYDRHSPDAMVIVDVRSHSSAASELDDALVSRRRAVLSQVRRRFFS